ncbi:outer dense fiber protein 3 [Salpingoeca rosetta]|uniref:Outer dense fiber protein 3 n=1 Tax=Salpingoeca rosetta (strain ATCC 50818 / BSB-021) TaxID=946362 RepID=F2UAF3_SALR5|nr:outer dense fiber protein 3 [Salpingoeca rosetta]EGD73728.1 outer dense fiber protein 3 [Salpingoeca rosetta]|eukprot:XP_004994009.1 outer dense fiber protein 3 [Salpingoeca rosetta]
MREVGDGEDDMPPAGSSFADRTRKVAPAFSFGARTAEKKTQEAPGPHYVDPTMSRHGKTSGSAFTISGRPRSTKKFASPGPGAYATEGRAPPRQRRSPAYSMGARVASPRKTEVPSPNNYTMPGSLGKSVYGRHRSGPSHSMGVRHQVGSIAASTIKKTPGPGTYNASTNTRRRAPAFSMTGRTEAPSDKTMKPGPGAHSPEKVTMHKRRSPAFSLGVRHSEYITPLIVDIPPE